MLLLVIPALIMTGEIDRARVLFEKLPGYSNHRGLYAEELGLSGEFGNLPQALTHLALIETALTLNEALEGKRVRQEQGSLRIRNH